MSIFSEFEGEFRNIFLLGYSMPGSMPGNRPVLYPEDTDVYLEGYNLRIVADNMKRFWEGKNRPANAPKRTIVFNERKNAYIQNVHSLNRKYDQIVLPFPEWENGSFALGLVDFPIEGIFYDQYKRF